MVNQYNVGRLLKGVYSAAIAALGALATVLSGNATFSDVTDGQWVTLTLAGLVAFGGTLGLAGWTGPTGPGIKPNGDPHV